MPFDPFHRRIEQVGQHSREGEGDEDGLEESDDPRAEVDEADAERADQSDRQSRDGCPQNIALESGGDLFHRIKDGRLRAAG